MYSRYPLTPCRLLAPCFKSKCIQKYVYHRLLSMDPCHPSKGLFIDMYRLPTACSCYTPAMLAWFTVINTCLIYSQQCLLYLQAAMLAWFTGSNACLIYSQHYLLDLKYIHHKLLISSVRKIQIIGLFTLHWCQMFKFFLIKT